ncbi:macrophage mannose receptor 1-like [Macrobrachium nipponense]|uniref:macrophage mannose receptor 1-like n=1 Tax=Macrobrachium nipponense TaxID=159736 RepID=UPI0030C7D29B
MMPKLNFVVALTFIGLAAAGPIDTDTAANYECPSPYQPVGPDNYCLLIDNRISGTWDEMRTFCKSWNGDLAYFHDANLLYEVVHYIFQHGLNDSSFWTGAEDMEKEGDWVWVNDHKSVRMHTPLWAPSRYQQEPSGGTSQNCATLNRDKHFFVDDSYCQDRNGVICDPLIHMKKKSKETADEVVKEVTITSECPVPFQLISDACLLIDVVKANTWYDSKKLCEALGGQLAVIDDANLMGDLYDYFNNRSVNMPLWIGGTDDLQEGTWLWEDMSPIKMGTPFWGLNTYEEQEPDGRDRENCLTMNSDNYFYFNDISCNALAGAICQYNMRL